MNEKKVNNSEFNDHDNTKGPYNAKNSIKLDIEEIYNKIAPYLSKPQIIKGFLETHSNLTKKELNVILANEIKNCDNILKTDFRILKNSI